MLTHEYGLPRDPLRPTKAALATFGAFLCAGTVPLLPFIIGGAHAFEISVAATLATFFAIGASKSKWALTTWWRSGGETLLIGAVAALIAYGVGGLFRGV